MATIDINQLAREIVEAVPRARVIEKMCDGSYGDDAYPTYELGPNLPQEMCGVEIYLDAEIECTTECEVIDGYIDCDGCMDLERVYAADGINRVYVTEGEYHDGQGWHELTADERHELEVLLTETYAA